MSMANKVSRLMEVTRMRKSVVVTMVSVYGIAHTGYWNTVQNEVTAESLFREWPSPAIKHDGGRRSFIIKDYNSPKWQFLCRFWGIIVLFYILRHAYKNEHASWYLRLADVADTQQLFLIIQCKELSCKRAFWFPYHSWWQQAGGYQQKAIAFPDTFSLLSGWLPY